MAPAPDTTAAVVARLSLLLRLLTVLQLPRNIWQQGKLLKPAKAKKQGTNEVVMYSEPPMPTHEAIEQPAPKPGAPPVVIHTKEYVYFIPSQKPSFPGGDAALGSIYK